MKEIISQNSMEEPQCTVGWPATYGYPNCDTTTGAELADTAPNIYQYCAAPMPIEMQDLSGIKLRPTYRQNVPKPLGVHSYYNVMWDGRVRRGDPAQKQKMREEAECERIRQRLCQPRKCKSFAERRQEMKQSKIVRESVSETDESIVQKELVRYAQLAIANLAPKDPEKYLVDLSDEIDIMDPCYQGRRLQTLRTFPVAPSRKLNLEDVGTQISPMEFFHFDDKAQPIIETLLGSVLEEAHLELLEEEELEALQNQQNAFKNKLQQTQENIIKWEERELRIEAEKKRLCAEQRRLADGVDEAMKLYNICTFSGGLTKVAISECVDTLRKEGFIVNSLETIIRQTFVPWLNVCIQDELKTRAIGKYFLDELLNDVVNMREAEFAEAIWREVYAKDPFKKYGSRDETTTAPPPTPGASLYEGDSEEEETTPPPTEINVDSK